MRKYYIFIAVLFFIMLIVLSRQAIAAETKQGFALSGKVENGIRIIEVKASRYKYEPDPIVVKLGEKVRIIVTSTDVDHGFAISEFNINASVAVNKKQTVEFVADKQGTFNIFCSVYCGPGHMNMRGKLIVAK